MLDKPLSIKRECLPHDDVDVDALLQSLHNNGHIYRYEASGKKCIEIAAFTPEQIPHTKEPISELPSREKKRPSPGRAQAKPRLDPGSASTRVLLVLEGSSKDLKEVDTTPAVVDELPTHCPKLPPELDTFEVRTALQHWASYKSAKGQKYKSPHGWTALLKDFIPLGPDALCKAVTHSMKSNYTGLFPAPGASGGGERRLSRAELTSAAIAQAFSQPDEI